MEKICNGIAGWEYFAQRSMHLIEKGLCTPESFARHIEEGQFGESWKQYKEWKKEHNGETPPENINSIRTDSQMEGGLKWDGQKWVKRQGNDIDREMTIRRMEAQARTRLGHQNDGVRQLSKPFERKLSKIETAPSISNGPAPKIA